MTAIICTDYSLYNISKIQSVGDGYPGGWGEYSPHPSGDPPHHVGR
nr:MAG TPA: enolase [Caudoviricetes sp.]